MRRGVRYHKCGDQVKRARADKQPFKRLFSVIAASSW
jgi:hypothetical protein